MICTKCGNEIPEDSLYCNKCGEKVLKDIMVNQIKNEDVKVKDNVQIICDKKTIKSNKNKLLLVFIIIFILIGFSLLNPYIKYYQATSNKNNKNYDLAINTYSQIINYKDAKDQIIECKYKKSIELIENKDYLNAINILQKLNGYKDTNSFLKQSYYQLGLEYYKNKKYQDAIKQFNQCKDYMDSNDIILESTYLCAKQLLADKEYKLACQYLKQIKNYKNADKLIIDATYNLALNNYKDGNFEVSNNQFKSIRDYKDSSEYIQKLSTLFELQGTWEDYFGNKQIIFSGWRGNLVYFPYDNRTKVCDASKFALDKNNLNTILFNGTRFLLNKEELNSTNTLDEKYTKINSLTDIPKEKESPKIGMTSDQVLNSTWGKPDDINRTITQYSISEQWVYDYYRYIYLENGIVTAIQD